MSHHADMVLGVCSTVGSLLVAQIPTDPNTIEALAKWPLTLVLAAVAIYAIYSMNKSQTRYVESQEKQAELYAASQDKHSNALQELARQLAERPCVRNPENN